MDLPKVIYVDDEPGLLEITKIFLEEGGDVQVDTEERSTKVLDLLTSRSYDVIVSDYQMPGMNGIELLKSLRKRGDLTPFILFTGRGREEVAIEALNSGADFYMQKGGEPRVQFGELKNAIIQLVQRKKAERQLVQSEQKYRDLVEGANNIILKLDPQGRITFLNQFGKEYFGFTSDVVGEPLFGALIRTEEYSEGELNELRAALSPGNDRSSTFTFPLRRRDGTKTWASFNVKRRVDQDGRLVELLVIGNDVTAAKNAETELQKSMSQLRAMLDSSDEGVLLLDINGDVVHFNRRLLEIWNLSPSMMEVRSVRKLIDHVRDRLKDPDAFGNYVDRIRSMPDMEGRRLVEFIDGRVFEEHTTPVIIGSSVIGRLSIFKTHSPGKNDGRSADCEAVFRKLYDDDLAAILFVEPQTGNIVDANDAACNFYGYDHDVLEGMSFFKVIETSPHSCDHGRSDEEGLHRYTSRHRLASGQVREVEVFIGLVDIRGRELLFTMAYDITDRKMLEDFLQEANRKLNLLYNITRHDVHNQLLALRANLDILKARTTDPEQKTRIDSIGASAESIDRQLEFTNTYQDFGARPQWQEVGALIDSFPLDRREIERLETSTRLRQLAIYGDPMLGKVFHHLLEGSVKYASNPTTVKLDCQESHGHLLITYEDIGPGIPHEAKERIFQSSFGRGTGMGLFLSREVLSITGMTIRENGEPGKGVRFELTVPHGQYRFEDPAASLPDQPWQEQAYRTAIGVHEVEAARDQGAGRPLA